MLALLVKERSKPIYIDNPLLQPGAGDPLALVDKAIGIMQRRAKERGKYVATFLLLDTDKCGESLQRYADALKHAKKAGLVLIWQSRATRLSFASS